MRLASSGVFCLRFPDHPFTAEVVRLAERIARGPGERGA